MNVREAAAKLECSIGTVYALVAARKIRFSRVGLGRGKIVISEEAIAEYLKAGEVGPELPKPAPRPRPKITFSHLNLSLAPPSGGRWLDSCANTRC